MNVSTYLRRIGICNSIEPTLSNLRRLHLRHMRSVPFENLDIHMGDVIELSPPKLYKKIVIDGRGGFCYELNGLFYWLLINLGFNVCMLSARVYDGTAFGLPFDHMLLLVQIKKEQYLVDVGFGDSFQEPLLLDAELQEQGAACYHLMPRYDGWTLYQTKQSSQAEPQYTFSLEHYQLSDFENMCVYHQTSRHSHFTQKRICSIATPEGRVSISNSRLIITNHLKNVRYESNIDTERDYRLLLEYHFGLSLSCEQITSAITNTRNVLL